MVIIYLLSNPSHIYDVFRVKVPSIVKPPSPVNIHVGGEVKFKIMGAGSEMSGEQKDEKQGSIGKSIWSSNNNGVLEINSLTGEARGLSEGKSEVMLSNHINCSINRLSLQDKVCRD